MAKPKAVPTKISLTKSCQTNSPKILSTTTGVDREGHSEQIRRQSKRLQGISASTSDSKPPATIQAMPSKVTPTSATLPAKVAQSRPRSSNKSSREKPSIDVSDGRDKTENKNSNSSEIEESSKKRTKNHAGGAKKRKADVPTQKPAKKQRKTNNPRPTTAKERFRLAAASDTRPLPWGEPEVWADTRPELCEALPWFRCWQGAGHTHGGYLFGMLLDEDQGERAYLDEQVVVTRAGGGIGKNSAGEYVQVRDQDSESGRIKAFINNEDEKIPMHVIIGQNNIHCPSKIPYRYCVADEFHITDHWDERSNGRIVVKFRFEKVDLDSKSWWAADGTPEVYIPTDTKALRGKCSTCNAIRPQVFASGWMCLNAKCSVFWIMDGVLASEAQDYNPAFLAERLDFDGFLPPYQMKPDLIHLKNTHGQLFPATRQCWEGIVCNLCGRCNVRRHWDAWRCRTEGCTFVYRLPMDVISATSVMGDHGYGFQGHGVCIDKFADATISREVQMHGLYREIIYGLDKGLTISHLISNTIINGTPGGADDLFYQMQVEDCGLERLLMKQSVVEDTYSRHFSHNFGMPYNYVVGHDNSTRLADSPSPIKEAMRRMTWAAKRIVLDGDFIAFNELLAVGYYENMKMNYHDDGEESLGPTVASISLGCPAKMEWRLKAKYWNGLPDKERKNYDPKQPILPGCRKPEERRRLNELAKTVSTEELNAAAQVALAFAKGESRTPPTVLELDLRHGDYMVMHGAPMQIYYEHKVTPTDKLRFGLTCRYVKPEKVGKDMRSWGDFTLDPANAYDGDLKLYDSHMEIKKVKKVTRRRIGAVPTQA